MLCNSQKKLSTGTFRRRARLLMRRRRRRERPAFACTRRERKVGGAGGSEEFRVQVSSPRSPVNNRQNLPLAQPMPFILHTLQCRPLLLSLCTLSRASTAACSSKLRSVLDSMNSDVCPCMSLRMSVSVSAPVSAPASASAPACLCVRTETMERRPGTSCRILNVSSANLSPYIDSPPAPRRRNKQLIKRK